MTVVFRDGLGDRLHTTDATGRAVEVVRFNPELLEVSSFEIAVRERAQQLSAFHDPAFSPFLRIDRIGSRPHTLAMVSERVMGRRLSTLLAEAEATSTKLPFERAMAWLRQIVAAVARLHARDLAHGALAPERLIVNESGDIVIAEYMLGEAIEALQWPRQLLWRRLRVAMPPSAGLSRVDQRADLLGIGTIALALIMGRQLRDEEFPHALPAILREVSARLVRVESSCAAALAAWLVRTLQHEYRPFGTMKEALAGLDDLLVRPSAPIGAAAPLGRARAPIPPIVTVPPSAPVVSTPSSPISEQTPGGNPATVSADESDSYLRHARRARWVLARRVALVIVAVGFTASIGASRYLPPAATKGAPQRLQDHTDAAPRLANLAPVRAAEPLSAAPGALLEASILLPPGWIEISAPVDMMFLEGGATMAEGRAGRLAAKAGVHDIEVVNQTLGFHETRHITVRPGGVTKLVVQLPFGIVDLNAKPWAEVWLDGQRVGETPIGNLSVPIGPHEFVFRHPEFGERRLAVSLTTAEPVRLSVDMTRQ